MPLDTDFIGDGHACPAEELVAITPKQHQQKPAIFTSASVERKKHLISDCKFPKKDRTIQEKDHNTGYLTVYQ